MKTFETEKGNIPEGATHYENETSISHFAWFKLSGDDLLCMPITTPPYMWLPCSLEFCKDSITPIPQANIETPEEKEVEWVNGDDVEAYGKLYKYVGLDPFNDNLCICLANQDDDPQCFSIEVLNKLETEAERVERERVNAIVEMASIAIGPEFDLAINDRIKDICSKIHDAGYRKESE